MNDTIPTLTRDSIPALAQYIEPASVRFTPDAPGWYVLAAGLLLTLLVIACCVWQYRRRNRYRRIALDWLEGEERRFLATSDYPRLVYAADMLLKRILIRLNKKEEVASLQGTSWLDYLNETCPSAAFTPTDAETVGALYDSRCPLDKQQVLAFTARAKQWIRKHRVR